MDVVLVSVVALVALALAFDFTNGFHDAANAVSTIVATRVLRPRWAVAWAAGFHFIAFMFFGTAVANTLADTIEPERAGSAVVFGALVGAITWNLITWVAKLPSSSSHALIGGLVGAGIASAGTDVVDWASVGKTAAFIVVAPVFGGLAAAAVSGVVYAVRRMTRTSEDARAYKGLQLLSSAAMSLGHGANDAQKTMGIIAALLVANGYLDASGEEIAIPLWVVLSAHAAIALGTLSGGWRIVRTMGLSITELRPATGFSAETGAAASLFSATFAGIPVSTTHTTAGAITGVGLVTPGHRSDLTVMRRMLVTWVVTIPAAAAVAMLVYWLTQLDLPLAVIGLLLAGTVATWLLARSYDRFGADDLERAVTSEPATAGAR